MEWIPRGVWESTRSRFRDPIVMNETVYNRLFGNIVGEQISETCSLVSAKRHPWKTAPPFPPFLFLPVVSHGRDAADSIPPMRYFRIVGHRRLHLRNTR